jgi:catechol 2,3-dioxygenase-like lactoylglutathione lyase family enzyme
MIPRSLSHVALGVRDYERSLHFYRDLLGFQVAQEITESDRTDYQDGISERSRASIASRFCATAKRPLRCTA